MKIHADGIDLEILVQGFPGRSGFHGALGWSTVSLIRRGGRIALMDTGGWSMRRLLRRRLASAGLTPSDITDVYLSHSHYDHAINWTMFDRARIVISDVELSWAIQQPVGNDLIPDFYLQELANSPRLHVAKDNEEVGPGITAHLSTGHTPGHLTYVMEGAHRDIIFTGDAAKNRAELISKTADLTYDAELSREGIARIWELWSQHPNSIVIPGHDVPMTQNAGQCSYLDKREATIEAWYGDDLTQVSSVDLGPRHAGGVQAI
jgi:N-acyl homoserine lactone hydrolase